MSGTSRQLTIGPLQLPLSEASKIISLRVPSEICAASFPNKSVTVGSTIKAASTADLYVGLKTTVLTTTTTVASIINSTTYTTTSPIVLTSTSPVRSPIQGSVTSGSNIVTVTAYTTANLYVGMQLNNTTYFAAGTVITSITDSTHFVASSNALATSTNASMLSQNARTITVNAGSNICTSSISDLVVGLGVDSTLFPAGTVAASVIDSTHFVASNVANDYITTATFSPDDYMMFYASNSNTPYRVPEGKTLYILSYPSQPSHPILYGYSTDVVIPDALGRLRSHITPTGAYHYANSPTDYTAGVSLSYMYMSFPSMTYPFIKTAATSVYPMMIGIEI